MTRRRYGTIPHGARKVRHVYDVSCTDDVGTWKEIGEKGFREPISRELENENIF